MEQEIEVHDSCGNIFADMGMPDAEERLARAEAARAIRIKLREQSPAQLDEHQLSREPQADR